MDRLKYISTERMYEGILTEINDVGVTIELKGRLGQLKIPLRLLITDYELKLGQTVGFLMTYPELIDPVPDENYVRVIEEKNKRKKEN